MWVCPSCTLQNPLSRPGCEACSAEQPQQHQSAGLQTLARALDQQDLVSSAEAFECRVCLADVAPGEGVLLRDCLHAFCRDCLADTVRHAEGAAVPCPHSDAAYTCPARLQDREIRALVSPEDYERHLARSVAEAAGAMANVFHCKTPDCRGLCVFEDNVNTFLCDICYKQNCLTCQAQHAGYSCKQYQEMIAKQQDLNSVKTMQFFDDMVRRGDGLPCPGCSVMLVRKWGCDWMRCPMCRTEICWVTRGARWGPQGAGDTSGGCRCGVHGRKCHPKCTYCH